MGNSETERIAIDHVMRLERAAGRDPVDVSRAGHRYDIDSPPRKIEVKAFGGSARSAPLPLEERQVTEAQEDPDHFFLYIVDNVTNAHVETGVRVLHGDALARLLARARPSRTYWASFRALEYDEAERLP